MVRLGLEILMFNKLGSHLGGGQRQGQLLLPDSAEFRLMSSYSLLILTQNKDCLSIVAHGYVRRFRSTNILNRSRSR